MPHRHERKISIAHISQGHLQGMLIPMPTVVLFCTVETSPRPLHPSMLPSSKVKDEYWLGETVGVGLGLPLPLPVGYVGCGCPGAVVGTGVGCCPPTIMD